MHAKKQLDACMVMMLRCSLQDQRQGNVKISRYNIHIHYYSAVLCIPLPLFEAQV